MDSDQQTQITLALAATLLAISEILGSFTMFKSNSIFQLLKNMVADIYKKVTNK